MISRTLLVLLLSTTFTLAQQDRHDIKARDLSSLYYMDTLPIEPVARTPGKSTPRKIEFEKTGQEGRRVGLKYKIQHCSGECESSIVDKDFTFKTGDLIRFLFESNITGYLYVINEGTSGQTRLLFPHPDVNGGRNQIRRGISYAVPPDGWITIAGRPGTEKVTVVLSRNPLDFLPSQAEGEGAPALSFQSVARELNREVAEGDLVRFNEWGPSVHGADRLQATVVVNNSEESNEVVFTELRLKHR